MAGAIALKSCKMQIRRKTGTLTSGADAINSITLSGVSVDASADALLTTADAVGTLVSTPIIEILRVDTQLVYEDA